MTMSGPIFVAGLAHPIHAVCDIEQNSQHRPVAIASNPNSSPSVLEGLYRVCSPVVLEHIATNPNTPISILEMVSRHPDSDVRASVAENSHTPKDCIWALVKDPDPDVRFQLAENHHLCIEVLTALTEDDNPYVACRARRTLERVERTKQEAQPETAAVENQVCDWQDFRRGELDKRIAQIRALSEGTPMTVLNKLFSSIYRYARAI